jgi:hypothetical protein
MAEAMVRAGAGGQALGRRVRFVYLSVSDDVTAADPQGQDDGVGRGDIHTYAIAPNRTPNEKREKFSEEQEGGLPPRPAVNCGLSSKTARGQRNLSASRATYCRLLLVHRAAEKVLQRGALVARVRDRDGVARASRHLLDVVRVLRARREEHEPPRLGRDERPRRRRRRRRLSRAARGPPGTLGGGRVEGEASALEVVARLVEVEQPRVDKRAVSAVEEDDVVVVKVRWRRRRWWWRMVGREKAGMAEGGDARRRGGRRTAACRRGSASTRRCRSWAGGPPRCARRSSAPSATAASRPARAEPRECAWLLCVLGGRWRDGVGRGGPEGAGGWGDRRGGLSAEGWRRTKCSPTALATRSVTALNGARSEREKGGRPVRLKASQTSMNLSSYDSAPEAMSMIVGPPAPPPIDMPRLAMASSAAVSSGLAKSSRTTLPHWRGEQSSTLGV